MNHYGYIKAMMKKKKEEEEKEEEEEEEKKKKTKKKQKKKKFCYQTNKTDHSTAYRVFNPAPAKNTHTLL